jgi:hypothetical protein
LVVVAGIVPAIHAILQQPAPIALRDATGASSLRALAPWEDAPHRLGKPNRVDGRDKPGQDALPVGGYVLFSLPFLMIGQDIL